MNASFELSTSVWGKSANVQDAPALSSDASADVVVVGAGLAGLSVAYELARAGRSVVALDRGPIGGGMTARTTAHLASELDDYYHKLIELRGLDEARQVYQAQAAAVDRIEQVAREEGIDCDFKRLDGYLFLGPGTDPAVLERELEAAPHVGLAGVAWAERAPIPGRDTGRCLRFPDQGRFHPLKYLDGLARCIAAFIGRNHGNRNVYIATGDSGQGMTNGAAAGLIISALVLGRESPFAAAHAPTRVTLSAAGEFLRENLTMAANMTEHVRGGEIASIEELKPGEGAIVRQGLSKVAAYRDESGTLHLRSAVCTHVGCIVHWNPFERCWDCPCHGSQFAIDGTALNGPAIKALAEVGPNR
jgi:Rieske Fe-S protein